MKLYGLIGYPLTHSFSKKYFAQKFSQLNITNCGYDLFSIEKIEMLNNVLKQHSNLCGLNVTIPYKQQVIPYLTNTQNLPIQACNTIHIINNQLIGYNTDVVGFRQSFTPLLKPHHTHALVLGSGGAAQAVNYVLSKLHITATTISRHANNGLTYQQLNRQILEQNTIIINTTPVGTYPNINECPALPYQFITPQHYCYDLVYNPTKTMFLQNAEANGATIKNGYDMLVLQAEESWRIWNEA
jgi:shikimate dehydrogenase